MKIRNGLGIDGKNTGFVCKNCEGTGKKTVSFPKKETDWVTWGKIKDCAACSGSGCWRPPVPGVKYAAGQQVRMGDVCVYFEKTLLITYKDYWSSFCVYYDDTFEEMTEYTLISGGLCLEFVGSVYSTEIQCDNEGEAFNFCDTDEFKRFQEEYQAKIKLWEEE